jgi:hypothetical protein
MTMTMDIATTTTTFLVVVKADANGRNTRALPIKTG